MTRSMGQILRVLATPFLVSLLALALNRTPSFLQSWTPTRIMVALLGFEFLWGVAWVVTSAPARRAEEAMEMMIGWALIAAATLLILVFRKGAGK
jgi:hypothetical protein